MANADRKNFLITGVSSGLGRAFAAGALARQAKSSSQPGDPAMAAQALLALIDAPVPPVRFFLGDDALFLGEQKLESMEAEIAAWDALSRLTSFTLTESLPTTALG